MMKPTHEGRNDTSNPGAHRGRTKPNVAHLCKLQLISNHILSGLCIAHSIEANYAIHIPYPCRLQKITFNGQQT